MTDITPSLETPTEPTFNEIIISDEDKEQFFKCIMADKAFEEVSSVFDGKLKLKFKSMSVVENSDILKQIALDRDAGIAENNDAYFITISAYRLALCLVEIDGKPFSPITKENVTEDDKSTYVKVRAAGLKNWPTFKLSAFLEVFNKFEAKVLKLTKSVQEENFWTASA